jgi:hypothetical protein
VIGDGAMSAGMAYEAMNNAGAAGNRLIVILNDNDMSIAPPVGAMSPISRGWSLGKYLAPARARKQLTKRCLPLLARAGGPRNSRAGCSPAARCSRSSASTMSARSTATISTTCCRC